MKRFQKAIVSVFYATVFLLVAGLVILFVLRDAGGSLADILFWVGAVPIAFFSVGTFGALSKKNGRSCQLSRSVSDRPASQHLTQDEIDKKAGVRPARIWMAAGLLVWLISYCL